MACGAIQVLYAFAYASEVVPCSPEQCCMPEKKNWLIDWLIDWLGFNGTFSTNRRRLRYRKTLSVFPDACVCLYIRALVGTTCKTLTSFPVSTSQSRAVVSMLAVPTYVLCGLNATPTYRIVIITQHTQLTDLQIYSYTKVTDTDLEVYF